MQLVQRVVYALIYLHPWHSMAVHFPIALASVAWLAVLAALWRRSELLEQFAFLNLALVSLSTALAGLAGLRDLFFHFGGSAPYVNAKIFLAVSLLVLTGATVVVRRRRPDLLWNPSTVVLTGAAFTASFLLAVVVGFLGGSIVYGF